MTAVEWLVKEIMKHDKSFTEYYGAEIEQANKIFEQQIIGAFCKGAEDGFYGEGESNKEKYYNETFKKD